ncbi:hypothetical protein [Shewanella khirikhana]|uniref:Uncharacterized protein n=1 Tax=Shewanella khirikhana TaxID=1965282 RepID=A0ABM9SBJ0_9GAMM|nr:hypothetical protein [Shewanella khirikhana]AZQ13279.1 hypothetical protein STH12_04253 [Shewanella khirikhana]
MTEHPQPLPADDIEALQCDQRPLFELEYNGHPVFVDMLTLLQCLKIAEHTHHIPAISPQWWLQITKEYPVEVNLDGRIQTAKE